MVEQNENTGRTCPSCGAEWMRALEADTCPGCGIVLSSVPRRQMGQPDARALCGTCGLRILRLWWGNGGWLWVHLNQRDECYPRTHANPIVGTVEELFPA